MYSIVKAVKDVIVCSQTTNESTAHVGLQNILLVGTTVLDVDSPLTVEHVRLVGQSEEDIPSREDREPSELSDVARKTREAFLSAFATSFVKPRYGPAFEKHSHLYDMAQFMTPGTKGMKYLRTLSGSLLGKRGGFVLPADSMKKFIIGQLQALLVRAIVKRRAVAQMDKDEAVDVEAPDAKKAKHTAAGVDSSARELQDSGMVDSSSDDDDEEEEEERGKQQVSPKSEANAILQKWQAQSVRPAQVNGIWSKWGPNYRKGGMYLVLRSRGCFGFPCAVNPFACFADTKHVFS